MEKILGIDLGTNSIGWAIRQVDNELENQITDKGVLTFDKGVAEDKSGEHPMVQKRTEARGKRRNYQAEKYRKWELLECLITEKMCPLTIEELNEWRHYTKGKGRKYPQSEKFIQWLRFDFDGDGKPDFERLGFSKHESYYIFRALIVDESQTDIFKREPHIIGRVLYQLVQRRGYNDGQGIDEKEKEELSKTIMKGGGDSGAVGANEIKPYITRYKTLGAALYNIQKENDVRIRKRYNLRSDFENEIKEICRVQGLEHLFKAFWGAIIWQRPLRSQKGLVGVCSFENNKRRCPISHPLYEEYRTWVFINNLKIKPTIENDIPINKLPLENALKDIVYPQFFKAAADFKLSSIAKELKKVGFEITARFPEDTKVISFSFLYKMREIFGEDWAVIVGWNDLLNPNNQNQKVKYNIEDLWHLHFTKTANKKTGEEPFEFLKRFAIEKLYLKDEVKVEGEAKTEDKPKSKAEAFAKIRLQQGYTTLSVNAIKKILPYLQKGFIYSEAIYLANLPKVMGNILKEGDIENYATIIKDVIRKDRNEQRKVGIINTLIAQYFENRKTFEADKASIIEKQIIESYGQATWNKLSVQTMANIEDEIVQEVDTFLQEPKQKPENHYRKTGRLHYKIFKEFLDIYGIPAENIKYLWHPSEQETYLPAIEKDGKDYLGSPEPISKGFKNPMALKTMHKLKRLVNYLIETDKIDKDTRIVIEIARELNDANKRKAIERWQRDREKENDGYKKQIEEINKECNTDFDVNNKTIIDKIRLWEEQKRLCIYTGKTIGFCDILNGSKYDFEHSIPASMSFDNELKNLTIADKTYNQLIKGKRLPSECPNYESAYTKDGITYPPILSTMQIVFGRMTEVEKKVKGKIIVKRSFEKIEHLENLYAEWKGKTSDDKQIKDNIIIRRHMIKMDLDYWRYKLQTFTTTEYKVGWRNSQLRDTQTITKYALPYLKTVFNKLEVQKGSITADFRKIYKIQPRLDKKERNKHSHHAIDAAVLTLIPPASIRDKILLRYNEAKENNQGYHEKPRQWESFHSEKILGIEDDLLINFQAQQRTLTPTYKTVRKRGEVQYVKEKLPNGKWQYKLDEEANKIPLKSNGDSIRGNLHDDTFYGAIKQPVYEEKDGKFIPQSDGQGSFIFQTNEKRKDNIFFVTRHREGLGYLKSFEDLELIIDPNLRNYFKKEIGNRIENGKTFAQALLEPIWAFGTSKDKNGNPLKPIRHIRTKVKGGGGGFINNPAEIKPIESYISKHSYKQHIYAQNGETTVCAFYQSIVNEELVREIVPYNILEISKVKDRTNLDNSVQKNIEKTIKKERHLIPLYVTLKLNQKVLFYENDKEELISLSNKELSSRLYIIVKFEDGRISLKHHLNSMSEDILKKEMKRLGLADVGASSFSFSNPIPKLRISKANFNFIIEGKHFTIKPDGEIQFI